MILRNSRIRDFCVVATLQGNDFLHKFPNVYRDTQKNFKLIFDIYSRFVKLPLTDSDNNIIWKNYLLFIKTYSTYRNATERDHLYLEMFRDTRKGYKEIEDNIRLQDKYGNIVNQVYNPEKHKLLFDFKNFRLEWYSKQFNENIVQWDGSVVESYTKRDIIEMVKSYLMTVQWVQYYYIKGYKYVSNFQFYHYLYNPLMSDVVSVLNGMISRGTEKSLYDVKRRDDEIEITPIHQLLSVLHIKNIDNIPSKFRKIYKNYLAELNPTNFEVFDEDYANKKEHQKHANIPLVNVPFIDEKINESELSIPRKFMKKDEMIIDRENPIDFEISLDDLI